MRLDLQPGPVSSQTAVQGRLSYNAVLPSARAQGARADAQLSPRTSQLIIAICMNERDTEYRLLLDAIQ